MAQIISFPRKSNIMVADNELEELVYRSLRLSKKIKTIWFLRSIRVRYIVRQIAECNRQIAVKVRQMDMC